MLSIFLALTLGILIGLIVGLLTGIVGTMLGLRTMHILKRRELHKKRDEEKNIAYQDINFLHSKFKDVG